MSQAEFGLQVEVFVLDLTAQQNSQQGYDEVLNHSMCSDFR